MILPLQTGYFDTEAEGKPLLHIWSLSLEEQYYFLLPLFLFVLPRSTRISGLILVFFVSLFWCAAWVTSNSAETPLLWRLGDVTRYEWAFYLLPTRAWELLAGSIVAWLSLNIGFIKIPNILKYVSLSTIFTLSIFTFTPTHPGPEAFIAVLATSALLLGHDNWLPKSNLTYALEKVGDWSYSIYLVHWPLFAFVHLAFAGKVPPELSATLIFASIFIGYMQYRFVETPFRHQHSRKKTIGWKPIAVATFVLAMVPITISSNPIYENDHFEKMRRVNSGFSEECENSFNRDQTLKPACKGSESIDTIVWGDSYAMHLVPGLSLRNKNIGQITKSVCGPFPGVAIVNGKYNASWAEACLNYNKKAVDYITNSPNIKYVIMSSPLDNYISSSTLLLTTDGLRNPSASILVKSFAETANEFIRLGKTVIFISPPPKDGSNIGECLERKYGPIISYVNDCSIRKKDYEKNQKKVIEIVNSFKKHSAVLELASILCGATLCHTEKGGVFLYRDNGHLTVEGSKILLKDALRQYW